MSDNQWFGVIAKLHTLGNSDGYGNSGRNYLGWKSFLNPFNPTNVPICCAMPFQMTFQKKQEMFLSLHQKRNSNKNKPSLWIQKISIQRTSTPPTGSSQRIRHLQLQPLHHRALRRPLHAKTMPHASRPLLRPCKPPTWISRLPTATGSMSASRWPTRLASVAYKALAANNGWGVIFGMEADVLSQTLLSDYGNYSTGLAPGFSLWVHHDEPREGWGRLLLLRLLRSVRSDTVAAHGMKRLTTCLAASRWSFLRITTKGGCATPLSGVAQPPFPVKNSPDVFSMTPLYGISSLMSLVIFYITCITLALQRACDWVCLVFFAPR